MSNHIAQIIMQQLGGNRFAAITGAHSWASGEKSLSFRVPKAKNNIRGVVIDLNDRDLYNMRFVASRIKPQVEVYDVASYNDLYATQLQDIFTKETGLITHL
jgi:hypothetical protein